MFDISWFMRCLNEGIAREANREDGCKGRFGEGRFKSQALLDERALLACMAYVDLNPIRAGLCESPETSDFTSVQERLFALSGGTEGPAEPVEPADAQGVSAAPSGPGDAMPDCDAAVGSADGLGTSVPLADFCGSGGDFSEAGLPFELADYLQLVDWTGRQWREDKRGVISSEVPPLLLRMKVEPATWIETVRRFRHGFHDYVGPVEVLQRRSESLGRRWLRGVGVCRKLWGAADTCQQAAGAH